MGSRARALLWAAALAAVALFATVGTAGAKQIQEYKFAGSFDGHESTAGAFTSALEGVAINNGNGRVYVLDAKGPNAEVSQFDASGKALPWVGLGSVSSFSPGGTFGAGDIAFDNFGNNLGLFVYGHVEGGPFGAWNEDGTQRLAGFGPGGGLCGMGLDPKGVLYAGSGQWAPTASGFTGFTEPGENFFFEQQTCHITFDSNGYGYLNKTEGSPGLYKYYVGEENRSCCGFNVGFGDHSSAQFSYVSTRYDAADLSTNDIYAVENEDAITEYSPEGQPITSFGGAEGSFGGLTGSKGVAINAANHDVYVTMTGPNPRVAIFHHQPPITVPDATTEAAGHPSKTSAVLHGTVNPDGVPTTECKFEWGTTSQYLNTGPTGTPCEQGGVFGGSSDNPATLKIGSLTVGQTYHYRIASRNSDGAWSYGVDHTFQGSLAPTPSALVVDQVNTDGARFETEISPEGGTTHYHFEVGTEDCATHACESFPATSPSLKGNLETEAVSTFASGLEADTEYFVRVVAENGAGTSSSSYTFHTYPKPPSVDHCGNAQVRQQVSAALLPDCRAYELVSPANAGGYDVESDLVPGETPFSAYPAASGSALFGLHFGSIPGIAGEPTNFGLDPYVAERGQEGWVTHYAGLPANQMADEDAFGSPLLGADEHLKTFAFGGSGICSPCFGGHGTNIPLRVNGGPPIAGMEGALDPGASEPSGDVAKYLSADGSHLVFGSTEKFADEGGENSLTIYERDLSAAPAATEVVSRDQTGAVFSGPGSAALDVSGDGSRVLVGKLASTDAAGNRHYHLYMHLAGTKQSADLTPGAASAVFDGMTADGSKVFLTTTDHLVPGEDSDESADIYEAEVGPTGTVALHVVTTTSTGAASNDDSCTPSGVPDSWNSVSGPGRCNAVAFAGGAGVAAEEGTFYFVSPELLEAGQGSAGEANLYVVKPGGHPHFVATIDSSGVKPPAPPANHPVASSNFAGGGFNGPEALAFDQASGYVYVAETGASKVRRLNADGSEAQFTEGTGAGTDELGAGVKPNSEGAMAVDNSGGSLAGDLYVADKSKVKIFSPTGKELGSLNGSGTNAGSFKPCGVAVDPSGNAYIGDNNGFIWRYHPIAALPFNDASYSVTGIATTGTTPCQVAVDSAGDVYAAQWANGPVREFEAASFAAGPPPGSSGTVLDNVARALAVDQSTNELYVNEGNLIRTFDPSGNEVTSFGSGSLGGSRGLAIDEANHHAFAPNGSSVVEFGYEPPPYSPVDDPAIAHGVDEAATHRYSDFQVTPDGRFAAFSSVMPLTGFSNLGHMEIFRYDSREGEAECASCAPSNTPATSDTTLSPHGLNLVDDGRVFFTTREALVLTDTNEKRDAYEWEGGLEVGRLSTGRSLSDSTLLSASADGKDAFFFTRDSLVTSDENGGAVKLYDAREDGGFLVGVTRKPCAASDECHGPSSPTPPAPTISSHTGEEKVRTPKLVCSAGFVNRHGKCVKKKPHHKKHHRHHKHRGGRNG